MSSGKDIGYLGCSKKFRDYSKSDKKSIREGTTHSKKTRACLLAFKFDQGLAKVGEFMFPDADCQKILCIKLAKLGDVFASKTPLGRSSTKKGMKLSMD
jgi:hypothetical protein